MTKSIVGNIYYVKELRRFFGVLGVHDDHVVCTVFCEYYEDAYRTQDAQTLTHSYIERATKVDAIDKLGHGVMYDGEGWKHKNIYGKSVMETITEETIALNKQIDDINRQNMIYYKEKFDKEQHNVRLWAARYEEARKLLPFWMKKKLVSILKEKGLM